MNIKTILVDASSCSEEKNGKQHDAWGPVFVIHGCLSELCLHESRCCKINVELWQECVCVCV